MAGSTTSAIARPLRTLLSVGVISGLSDGQLLDRFAIGTGEAAELAFQAIIDRHGPMVLEACRRVLDDSSDAEDAFQATFLVLLHHSRSIRDRGSVGSWLHGVAFRVAARARVERARRRRIERRGIRPSIEWNNDTERHDVEMLIHEELTRLPEKYRAPIVLCYLEGLTHEGAADQLGWPVGTVRGRLSRARDLLRVRLTRRGVTASAALAAMGSMSLSARAAVPTALCDSAIQSALTVTAGRAIAAVASTRAAAWADEASRRVVALHYLKTAAAVISWVGAIGIGVALAMGGLPSLSQQPSLEPPAPADAREANRREMLQLKGTWTSMQMIDNRTIGGVPQPPKPFKLIWSIDRDTITTSDEDGFASGTYRFTVDPGRSPKTIELMSRNLGRLCQESTRSTATR